MTKAMYINGKYLENIPTWTIEDAPWKAQRVLKILSKNNINPKTICDVGCGAGGILAELQRNMPGECNFCGYEISPQALEMCKGFENDRLHFKLSEIEKEEDVFSI